MAEIKEGKCLLKTREDNERGGKRHDRGIRGK